MITGFNTDVEYDGVTYHVQTEDKGLRTPFILCLVYNGGTILARRRVPYEDLVESGFDEKELAKRLQKLHKTVCAAISKGRLDDLKQASDRPAAVPASAGNGKPAVTVAAKTAKPVAVVETPAIEPPIPMPPDAKSIPAARKPARVSKAKKNAADFHTVPVLPQDFVEALVPEDIVQIISDLAGTDRPTNQKLSAELIGDSEFTGGETKSVVVLVCRGTDQKIVPDAEIMIKVMGSSFKPLIFHTRSNPFGIASVEINLPDVKEGRAAVVVRVMHKGEEVEVRRPLRYGTRK